MRAAMLLLAMLCGFSEARAQEVTIGTGGSTSYYLPTHNYELYSLTQQIYTAQEIGMAGSISYISFYNTGHEISRDLSIYMLHTNKSEFNSNSDWVSLGSGSLVYSGNVTFAEDGWTSIYLDTPFTYNGSSNLLIGVADNTGGWDTIFLQCLVFATDKNQAIYVHRDSPPDAFDVTNPNVNGTPSSVKNQIVLGFGSTCPPPSLAFSNISSNTATLTWKSGSGTYNVEYRLASSSGWIKLFEGTNLQTYTLTNLSTASSYEVRVQSVCAGGDTSDWIIKSFTTTAIPTDIGSGWSDGFEGSSFDWQLINGSFANKWIRGSAVNNGGNRSLYVSDNGFDHEYTNEAFTTTKIFAVKLFNFPEGQYSFSYDWQANGEILGGTPKDYLRVALVPGAQTPTAGMEDITLTYNRLPSGWIALDGGKQLCQNSSWQTNSVTITVSGTYYLAFIWTNDSHNYHNPPAAIDNVSISHLSCPYVVEGLTASSSSSTEATLSWTAGGATRWQVAYSTNSSFAGATIKDAYNPYITISKLTSGTTYYARVRSCCSDQDFGAWSNPVSFECTAKKTIGSGTETLTGLPTATLDSNSLSQQIYKSSELGEAGSILSIDFFNTSAECSRNLSIYMVSTSKSKFESKTDWVSVTDEDLVFSGNVTFLSNAWTTIQLNKSFEYNGTSNVVLVVDDNTGYRPSVSNFRVFTVSTNQALYISNDGTNFDPTNPSGYAGAVLSKKKNQIRVLKGELPSTLKPSDLTVNCSGTTATINWTERGNATQWKLAYRVQGSNDFTEITTSQKPYSLTGLDLGTTYEVKVRSIKGSDQSEWTSLVTFATAPWMEPTALAVSEEAPYSVKLSWTENSVPAATSWVVGYKVDGAQNFTEVAAGTNPFTLTGLAGNTTYNVKVRPSSDAASDKWSSVVSFTTLLPIFPPTNLKATNVTHKEATLSWTENSDPKATSWVVAYKANGAANYTEVAANSNPFKLTGLTGDTKYKVKVRPAIDNTVIKWSDELEFTTISPIYAPTQLTVSEITHKKVKLSWTENSDPKATSWVVAYKADGKADFTEVNVSSNPYTLTGLTGSTKYTVKVRPAIDNSVIKWSEEKEFTTISPIYAPTQLTASEITHKEVKLSWTENSDPKATSWVVAYKADGETDYTEVTASSNPFTLTSLRPEIKYTVKVRPAIDANVIKWSAELEFTTLSPIYAPTQLTAETIGTNDVVLSWKENSDPADTKWWVYYKADGEEDFLPAVANSIPYTLANLTPETKYTVKVCPFKDVSLSKWSDELPIITAPILVPPTPPTPPANIAVSDVTTDAATLTWTGDFESYDIQLTTPKQPNESAFEQVGETKTTTAKLTQYSFNLKDYSGKGWIAIRHFDVTNQGQLIIDDIELTNSKGEKVLTENFENELMPTRWHNFNNYGNPYVWTVFANSKDGQGNSYGRGSYYAESTSSLDDDQPSDNWLIIVPDMELGGTLTLYARSAGNQDYQETFGVYVALANPVIPETTTTIEDETSPYTLSELASGRTYNVKVKGFSGITQSDWSDAVTFTTETVDDSYLLGDVNDDGSVTPADAIMILYHYFGVEQSDFNDKAADVNGDQSITPADAIEALYTYFNGNTSNGARATRSKTDVECEPE